MRRATRRQAVFEARDGRRPAATSADLDRDRGRFRRAVHGSADAQPLRAHGAGGIMEAVAVVESPSRAPLVVYTIVARERDGRKFWVRIGTAFRNRDGSVNAILDAMPTNGTLHIRPFRAPLGSDGARIDPPIAEPVEE
jgi:hypothetical protein